MEMAVFVWEHEGEKRQLCQSISGEIDCLLSDKVGGTNGIRRRKCNINRQTLIRACLGQQICMTKSLRMNMPWWTWGPAVGGDEVVIGTADCACALVCIMFHL